MNLKLIQFSYKSWASKIIITIILCVPYSQVHSPDQWWLFLQLSGLVDGSLMMWDLHVRLHRTQFLCCQLLYTISTRMCNLFWTRSGRRLSYPVWWVFSACTEYNLSVPWISTYSRLETDSAKGYTGRETSGRGLLSRAAPLQVCPV